MLPFIILLAAAQSEGIRSQASATCAFGADLLSQFSEDDRTHGLDSYFFIGSGLRSNLFEACPGLKTKLAPHLHLTTSWLRHGEPGASSDAPSTIGWIGSPDFNADHTQVQIEFGYGCKYTPTRDGAPPPLCGGSFELHYKLSGGHWVAEGATARSVA